MKKIKALADKIFDIIEVYIPTVSFCCLFICYIIIVAYRYIFYENISWMYEFSVFTFIWFVVFAASYGSRKEKHIVFSIVYDKRTEKTKLVIDLIGNLFILVVFIILLPNAYNSVSFMAVRKSPIMKIPYSIIYSPFIIFVILTLIHHSVKFVKTFKLFVKILKGRSEG